MWSAMNQDLTSDSVGRWSRARISRTGREYREIVLLRESVPAGGWNAGRTAVVETIAEPLLRPVISGSANWGQTTINH